jgi:nucleotidyltransferase substrate binding protein (TIGR01987 family)
VTKSQSLPADFARAVTRLDEALALPKDPIVRDSAIQRFEISFELCWKFLKAYLEKQHNALYTSLRTCFRSAFRHGVIDQRSVLDRSDGFAKLHRLYHNEQLADYVYSRLAETALRFRAVLAATVID